MSCQEDFCFGRCERSCCNFCECCNGCPGFAGSGESSSSWDPHTKWSRVLYIVSLYLCISGLVLIVWSAAAFGIGHRTWGGLLRIIIAVFYMIASQKRTMATHVLLILVLIAVVIYDIVGGANVSFLFFLKLFSRHLKEYCS